MRGYFALQAAAETDEPLRVRRQQLLVDPWLAIEAFCVPRGDQFDQVVPALARFGQQDQVVVRLGRWPPAVVAAPGCDVHLAPENRLDPPGTRVVVERNRREHVAVL